MRIPTLHDVQFISQTIPGGKHIYAKLYEVAKDSQLLSKVTRKLLNI